MASKSTQKVSSIWLIRNSTGGPLSFQESKDSCGNISPIPYPKQIPSGKWEKFVHDGDSENPSRSVGSVTYRFKNEDGEELDWEINWHNVYQEGRKIYSVIKPASNDKKGALFSGIGKPAPNRNKTKFHGSSATVEEVPDDACRAFAIFQGIIKTE